MAACLPTGGNEEPPTVVREGCVEIPAHVSSEKLTLITELANR